VELVGTLRRGEHRVGRLHLVPRSADEKPRRGVGSPDVAGDLRADEPVVRHVVVERGDHPVAVGPRVGPGGIGLEPVALGEPDDVEPMPRPAFTVPGRVEQPLDQRAVGGIGASVAPARRDEGLDLLGRWRQADEIEKHPADECPRVGFGRGRQSRRSQRDRHEGVDRIVRRAGDRRHRGAHDRLNRPVPSRPLQPTIAVQARQQFGGKRAQVVRPRGTGGDPLLDQPHLVGRKRLPVGRHQCFPVGRRDPAKERACGRTSRHDAGVPRIAPRDRALADIDAVPAFRLGWSVARAAPRCQEWCHPIPK